MDLSRITPGVISALWRLEELCIEFKLNFSGSSECIIEVMRLSKLTYLDLTVPSIDDIPAQCFNSEKLRGFFIQIGKYHRSDSIFLSRSARYLILSIVHLKIPLAKWLQKMIEGSRPVTVLIGIENLNKIMPTLYHQGFNKLEHIQLGNCPNVTCLADDITSCDRDERKTKEKYFMELRHLELLELNKLEVIWKCPDEYVSLANLVTLKIWGCHKLVRIFTVSVAQGLVNLKDLWIGECNGLEEVIYGGGDDESGNVIVFRSLANISFHQLSKLKRLYSGNISINYPSLVFVNVCGCDSMKIWGSGIHKTPNLNRLIVNYVVQVIDGPSAINEAVAKAYEARKKQKQQADLDN